MGYVSLQEGNSYGFVWYSLWKILYRDSSKGFYTH